MHSLWQDLWKTYIIWWRHQMETFSPRYWPFVRGIRRSQVNSLHKGQWRGALKFSLNCVWINRDWWFETPSPPLWRHCNDTSLTQASRVRRYNNTGHHHPSIALYRMSAAIIDVLASLNNRPASGACYKAYRKVIRIPWHGMLKLRCAAIFQWTCSSWTRSQTPDNFPAA